MLCNVRKSLNFEDWEWYYSVVDVVAMVTGEKDPAKARKYWSKLKSRLIDFTIKPREGEMSEIDQIELVTKILNNCLQLKMTGKDNKLYSTDAMSPATLNDLIQFIPSRNKKAFDRKFAEITDEIKNPSLIINF
jgi:hypothetical protein